MPGEAMGEIVLVNGGYFDPSRRPYHSNMDSYDITTTGTPLKAAVPVMGSTA